MERKPIAARIPPAAHEYIGALAEHHQVSRADVFPVMLAVASTHPDEITRKIQALKESFV